MKLKLERDKAALLVIDVQERLCAAMDRDQLDRLMNRTVAAIRGARALGVPVIATEQYPKGLGPTSGLVKVELGDEKPVEKIEFSAAVDEVMRKLGGRSQVMVTGMEAHVCVFQTVRDLAGRGVQPYLCVDAALSRTDEDRRIGVDLCREAGAVITTVEAALFDLLGKAGTPEFKAVSNAVR
ncbi:MAG TPA: isochorismatase family protein [Myxococcaceae bacterium]|nr:isochorismatase family protein [Myxococcaceae bacterium]